MPAELKLTAEDKQWLRDIDRAITKPLDLPQHVVGIERYCAAIESNEYITRENFRLRTYRRRMAEVGRKQQKALREWQWGALVALVCLGLMCAFWIGRKW